MFLRFRTARSCFFTNSPEGPGEMSKGRAPGQTAGRLADQGCRGQRGPRSGLGAVKQVVFQELLFLFRKSVRAGKLVTDGGKDGECQRKAPQPPGQRRGSAHLSPGPGRQRPPAGLARKARQATARSRPNAPSHLPQTTPLRFQPTF